MDTKTCKDCGMTKPVDEFYRAGKYRASYCKPCVSRRNVKYVQGLSPEAKTRRIARIKAWKYGMTLEEMQAIVEAHDDNCDLCGKPDTTHRKATWTRQLTLDHDHDSGKYRGLLCSSCNLALGHAGNDPDLLRRMADYIERYR